MELYLPRVYKWDLPSLKMLAGTSDGLACFSSYEPVIGFLNRIMKWYWKAFMNKN